MAPGQGVGRAETFRIEQLMRQMPQVAVRVVEYFSKGVYAREIHIPKGTALTGRIHKFANLNILSQGDMSIKTDDGVLRIQAPYTVVSPPGTKRIAYAHEDCIWTTVHGTDQTDSDVIEEEFTTNSEQEYLSFVESLQIQGV